MTPVERKNKVEATKAKIRAANQMAQAIVDRAAVQLQVVETVTVTAPTALMLATALTAHGTDRNAAIVNAVAAGRPRKEVASFFGITVCRVGEIVRAAKVN